MSSYLDLAELRKVFSLSTSDAIMKAYELSAGSSITVLSNSDLLSLVDEIGGVAGQIHSLNSRIDQLVSNYQVLSDHANTANIERLEAQIPHFQSNHNLEQQVASLTQRIEALEP